SQVTIKAPNSMCTMPTGAPVYVKTGTLTVTTTTFTTGVNATCVPGSNQLTTITSTVTSYPYPGTSTKATDRSDCAGTTCTYAEEMTNYANWWAYYRMRMQMAKSAASISFSGIDSQRRIGYMSINNNTGSDFLNVADASTASGGQKSQWYAKFVAAKPGGSTPLRTALSLAGRYYAGKTSKINGITTADPMQYSCQRNYTILSTDGYWNESTSPVKIDGSTAIGDQDSASTVARPMFDGNAVSNTLADVAYYYYNTDIRDSAYSNTNGVLGSDVANNNVPDKQQRMSTSTVGLGASGFMRFQSNYATAKSGDYYDVLQGTTTSTTTAGNGICTWQTTGLCNWPKAVSNTQTTIDDLWHAAVNGGGIYFSAANPADLKDGLKTFLQKVDGATSDAAAATTSNPNVSSSDNFIFKSTFRSSDWYGEMARYTIDINTGALSTVPDWSESGTLLLSDGKTKTTPLLDNLLWTSRRIFTYNPAAANSLISFDWTSLTTTMQGYFKVAAISSLQQMCSSGTVCLDASLRVDSDTNSTTGAGGLNLVNYLRGDRTNEGPDASTYYRQRTHVLGDIVDSQAVYVKAPQFNYVDTGYASFKSTNASRQSMLYVGANDGMLHAFDATTGAEVWSYIPSMLLPNLYKLADKNYAGNHNFYINATPRQGDVYYDGSWHTILVSGLGAGGRGFFALDISNPVTPKVLWEFTNDTSKGTGYTTDADMGYSYGQPLLTKLSDGTWVVMVTSGYNNVSPGGGHGIIWVLNAKTGTVIKKIDTGAGSTTTTVAGCSAIPCPAGLAKISAYVESGGTNNTALRIYGGDLLGNVWRVNVTGLTGAGGTADVQLLATLANASNVRQPVTGRPEVGNVNGKPVIFVGTGAYLGVSDVSTTGQQSIYAILDPLTSASGASGLYGSPRGSTCTASIKTNCFVKQTLIDNASNIRTATSTVSYAVDFTTMYGWYVDLPETGERANTDPDLQLGTLAYTTNIPSSSNACSVGGSSYINFLDYRTGLTVPGADRIGNLLTNGSTTALATAPTLVRLPNGKVISITNLSDGSTVTTNTPISATNLRTRRVSWRELINTN
ncbi:PilC/PilY family type IV pilus protein, partial [Aquabacterium sp.]|uniref:pilus assembly protein n=1 Tax=Aquabacterium sp. TaxID=1872578 RepID=UPI0025C25366